MDHHRFRGESILSSSPNSHQDELKKRDINQAEDGMQSSHLIITEEGQKTRSLMQEKIVKQRNDVFSSVKKEDDPSPISQVLEVSTAGPRLRAAMRRVMASWIDDVPQ